MRHFFSILFLLSLSIGQYFCEAQNNTIVNFDGPVYFELHENLPKKLLTERTAVLIKPLEIATDLYKRHRDWRMLAEQVHPYFKKSRIDAIAYFNVSHILASAESKKQFSKMMRGRDVENIIFLTQIALNDFQIVVTKFNREETIVDQGQYAHLYEGANLDGLLRMMLRDIAARPMSRANFLINDEPECFDDIALTPARKYMEFAADSKLDKLAVPGFTSIDIPAGASPNIKTLVEQYNSQMRKDSLELLEIMKEYPFQYTILDPQTDHEIYRNLGYQFVLQKLHTDAYIIKRMLNYKIGPRETDYITQRFLGSKPDLKTIPIEAPVTKFYMKHIYSKDVYLGAEWDSDLTWQQALKNYIRGLKLSLKVE